MKDFLALGWALGWVPLLAVAAPAQHWFQAPLLAAQGQTYRAVADLDGDGRTDLLAVSGDTFTVLLGQGGGRFAAGPTFTLPIASNGYDALIDVDGDGRLDFVYVAWPALEVVVLPGQAGGAFGAPIQVPIPASGARVRGGDGNGDGVQDIAVDGYNVLLGGPVAFWILGDAGRQFQVTAPLVFAPTVDPKGVCVFDGDGDGDDDLAVCSRGQVLLAFSQPGGVLAAGPSIAIGGLDAWIAAADLDRDLDVDLVTVHQAGTGGVLTRLVNQGSGFTAAALPLQTFAAVGQPHAGDWNGDGFPDVLVRGFSSPSGYCTLLGNDGAGLLAEAWSRAYVLAGNLVQPGLADVDGDGNLDFVDAAAVLPGDGTLADPQGGPVLGDLTLVDDQDDGDPDATDGVLTYRNDGTGAFAQRAVTLPPPPAPGRFFGFPSAFADFDGDGLREALVTVYSVPVPHNPVFEVMHRLEEQSDGTFVDLGPAAAPGLFLDRPSFAADTDGDGVLDVVSPTAVWVNNGAHTFAPLPPAFAGFEPLQPGDVDGDGRVDFLAGFGGVGQGIAILRQTGGHAFTVDVLASTTSSGGRHQPALFDFDDDGDLDVAAAAPSGAGPRLWLNQGGVFAPGPSFPLPVTNDSACLGGDVDGDGRADLAFASADRLWVMRRNSAALTYDPPVAFAIDGARALVDVDQDGDLDAFGRGIAQNRRFDGPDAGRRRQYGQPSPGLGGRLPVLGCAGIVRSGEVPVLRLRQAVGGAFALLTMGFAESDFASPVIPGLTGYAYPFASTLGFVLGGTPGLAGRGTLDLPLAIPPGFAGTTVYFQAFAFDPGSPNGIPHSNGLEFAIGG